MAAQCWLNNTAPSQYLHQQSNHQQQQVEQQPQQQTFISSSAYYGYVPAATNNSMTPTINNSNNLNNVGMDVDVEEDSSRQKRLFDHNLRDRQQCFMRVKKRCLVQDDVPGYMHSFKRFREGEQWLSTTAAAAAAAAATTNCPTGSKNCGLAQMYHEPIHMNQAVEYDCRRVSYQQSAAMTMTGNLIFQPANGGNNSELEDMLLLTHGCSSYHHHYRHSQATTANIDSSYDEAEF